jgi:hypothetical protein
MLKLNVNQEKQLTFEVQIGGVQSDQIESYLRLNIDNIEYGFPAKVGQKSISVNLPPLRTVTARKLKEGEEVQVKLEITADGNHLTPWSDVFRLVNPVVVEAKIVDDEFNAPSAFKTKLVHEGKPGDEKQGIILERVEENEDKTDDSEDALTEKIVNKLAEKLSSSFGGKKKRVVEQKEKDEAEEEEEGEEKREVEEKCKTEDVKPLKKISKKDLLNMTEEDVYAYMERAGTKNSQVQKIIYEQAKAKAGSSRPVLILQQVVKMLKANK